MSHKYLYLASQRLFDVRQEEVPAVHWDLTVLDVHIKVLAVHCRRGWRFVWVSFSILRISIFGLFAQSGRAARQINLTQRCTVADRVEKRVFNRQGAVQDHWRTAARGTWRLSGRSRGFDPSGAVQMLKEKQRD